MKPHNSKPPCPWAGTQLSAHPGRWNNPPSRDPVRTSRRGAHHSRSPFREARSSSGQLPGTRPYFSGESLQIQPRSERQRSCKSLLPNRINPVNAPAPAEECSSVPAAPSRCPSQLAVRRRDTPRPLTLNRTDESFASTPPYTAGVHAALAEARAPRSPAAVLAALDSLPEDGGAGTCGASRRWEVANSPPDL